MASEDDLVTFVKVAKSKTWRDATQNEMETIEKNKTRESSYLSTRIKPIGFKWIFKTKLKENGEIDKFKARLVAKGYTQ